MPSFLNRNADAIREFETLVGQQGGRADAPHLALPYVHLGDAYKRAGRRADARATYPAGAKLFPDNVKLQQRAAESGGIGIIGACVRDRWLSRCDG